MVRGIVGYKVPQYLKPKTEELLDMVLGVAQEQLICNLPTSKVLIFIGQDEGDPKKEQYTFKLIGGEKPEDDEEEEEEDKDDELEGDSDGQ